MTEGTTRKYNVSFEVSVTTSEQDESAIMSAMLELTRVVAANESVTDTQREMLVQYMTSGVDGVIHYLMCDVMLEAVGKIKNKHEDSFEFSEVTIKEVK